MNTTAAMIASLPFWMNPLPDVDRMHDSVITSGGVPVQIAIGPTRPLWIPVIDPEFYEPKRDSKEPYPVPRTQPPKRSRWFLGLRPFWKDEP